MNTENTDNKEINENEAKEVSLLKQNAKFALKLLLGKQKPPVFLKWLCYFFIVWDLLLIVFYLLIGIGKSLFKFFSTNDNVQNFGYMFCLFHVISFIGVLLIWRRKLIGFYLFTIINIVMLIMMFVVRTSVSSMEISAILFTLISIGLFALNWNKFDYNIRKKAEQKRIEELTQ